MKILIVSGFLGAGKTTFIKELTAHLDKSLRFVILENDYGETNLDSQFLSEKTGADIWDLTEGCACCTMKQDFISTLITIESSLSPELLIFEPSGVAKLGDLIGNIKKLNYDRFEILSPVVIFSPLNYFEYLKDKDYKEIYEEQIKNAGQILFSKTKNLSEEYINDIAGKIKKISPDSKILIHGYENQSQEWWQDLITNSSSKDFEIHEHDHEHEHENLPSELTLIPGEFNSYGELTRVLYYLLFGNFGKIVRAKGVLKIHGEWIRFEASDGRFEISSCENPSIISACVLIGKDIQEELAEKYFHAKKHYHEHHHH